MVDLNIRPQDRISLIYVIVALLWIFFSDHALTRFFSGPSLVTANLYKGYLFVLVTGVLLFFLVSRDIADIERSHAELVRGYDQTIRALVETMDTRHRETADHSFRVTRMAVELAKLAGIPGKEIKAFERGALLHDIGKIGIPDSILVKPGPLNSEERSRIEEHPVIAKRLLSSIENLSEFLDIPYSHHER